MRSARRRSTIRVNARAAREQSHRRLRLRARLLRRRDGLMSGELQETTLTASRWSYDRRDIDPNETAYSTNDCLRLGTYTPISTARFTADHALKLLEGWTDDQVPDHRTNPDRACRDVRRLHSHSARRGLLHRRDRRRTAALVERIYSRSRSRNSTPRSRAQRRRRSRRTRSGMATSLNLALVGRARAELDAGQQRRGSDDAALVPTGFVYDATYDAATDYRTNRVFSENNGHGVTGRAAVSKL